MSPSKIDELLDIVKEINEDEFRTPISNDDKFEELKQELLYLSDYVKDGKERKRNLIEHLTNCLAGNFFKSYKVSDKNDELDVIGMAFNTYIEELEAQIVSKEFFNQIINFLPHKMIVLSEKGELEITNYINLEFPPFIQNFNADLLKDELPLSVSKRIKKCFRGETAKESFNYRTIFKNKQLVYNCSLERIEYLNKVHFLFVAKDISEEKEEQLKILKATINGQDQERIRLAKDLHDSLGQELNAINMYFNALGMISVNDKKYLSVKEEIHSMLKASIKSIQNISFDLMPSVLERNNLKDAISQLVNKVSVISEIYISYDATINEISFKEKKVELSIYRVVQEFLNNSIKYSNASRIEVNLFFRKNLLIFELKDNGDGFDFETNIFNHGINNIKQRLDVLGANYKYTSEKGKGTFLEFNFDINNLK